MDGAEPTKLPLCAVFISYPSYIYHIIVFICINNNNINHATLVIINIIIIINSHAKVIAVTVHKTRRKLRSKAFFL